MAIMDELIFYPTNVKVDATNSFFAYDPYIETFWLKVLGPTATLLTNYLTMNSMTNKGAFKAELSDLSFELGTGARSGKQSPVSKQLKRLVQNEIIFQISDNEFLVPKCISPMSGMQLSKLDIRNRNCHEVWIHRLNISPLSTQRKRMKSLLCRLDLIGVERQAIENAISSCGLHPSIIGEAITYTSLQMGAA